MSTHELIKMQIDTLPEQIAEKVLEFISFQRYQMDSIDDDTEYLLSMPGVIEKIEAASLESVSESIPVSELWSDV